MKIILLRNLNLVMLLPKLAKKCHLPSDQNVYKIETSTGLTATTNVNSFCGRTTGGAISILAVAVSDGICGYDEPKLLLKTVTDYGCQSPDNKTCRRGFVWRTREVIFVDLLSSSSTATTTTTIPEDTESISGDDSGQDSLCRRSHDGQTNYNQTDIHWEIEPVVGEVARLHIGDDLMIEKQLSDDDGISFLILMEDPLSGEVVLMETPKAGGDNRRYGSVFAFAILSAVIISGVCLCCGCCCYEYRNSKVQLRSRRPSRNKNDSDMQNGPQEAMQQKIAMTKQVSDTEVVLHSQHVSGRSMTGVLSESKTIEQTIKEVEISAGGEDLDIERRGGSEV